MKKKARTDAPHACPGFRLPAHIPGMTYNPATQPRSLNNGRFLPGPTARESSVSLSATLASQQQANAYRHVAEGSLAAEEGRRVARQSVQELLADGTLHRMVGTSNISAVESIMNATRDPKQLDAALAAVAADEEAGSPVPAGGLGKRIAKHLLHGTRGPLAGAA